jgi:P-type Ca2+ transporter type 2C
VNPPDTPAVQPEPTGLSSAQASAQLARDGPNRLPQGPRRTLWVALWAAVTQPMFLLLLAAAAVYALLGSVLDAATLLASVVVVAAITVYQDLRTERVLQTLKDLASPRSRVRRDGQVLALASTALVRGDLLLVAEGDRLACDARLVQTHSLMLDESLLTGESAPVLKEPQQPLHAGSLVVAGDGVAVVTATGAHTTLARIGKSLAQIVPRDSRVQAELKQVVRRVAVAAAATCLLAAAIYAWRYGSAVQGLLVGLTLAMAVIPEEFAVVWTVMMALGAWRLSRRQVLTRQPQAIEALGAATVLCVDKTGTLTHNRMALLALATPTQAVMLQADAAVGPAFDELLQVAARASVADALEPMDRAILRHMPQTSDARLVQRQSVAPGRPFVVHGWQGDVASNVAIKGAVEAVLPMCNLDADTAARVQAQAQDWGRQGLRVLAVAHKPWQAGQPLPGAGLQWVGLLGFMDPLRAAVPGAVAQCHAAGIRVLMITGDSPITAAAIAAQAGLGAGAVMTGAELEQLNDEQLTEACTHTQVFARVSPQHKLRVVAALQRQGQVVAMTGDGVNDAMALRAADIGVAMGQRGTDVAREAASLVLLDDSFDALVHAVRLGRRIFGNLQRSVHYLIAVHVPIVAVSLIPVLFHGPVLLLPLHVVLLELIIDPACSLVFEAAPDAPGTMRQPPRAAAVRLLSWRDAGVAAMLGVLMAAAVGAVQWLGHQLDWRDESLRLAALLGLVLANVALLLGNLGRQGWRNRALGWLLLGITLVFGCVLMVPALARALGLPVGLGV